MKPETECKILNLCKGKTIKEALYRLEIMQKYCRENKLSLRIKLVNIKIGD